MKIVLEWSFKKKTLHLKIKNVKIFKTFQKKKENKKETKKERVNKNKNKTRQEILVKSDFNKNFIFASFKQKKRRKKVLILSDYYYLFSFCLSFIYLCSCIKWEKINLHYILISRQGPAFECGKNAGSMFLSSFAKILL